MWLQIQKAGVTSEKLIPFQKYLLKLILTSVTRYPKVSEKIGPKSYFLVSLPFIFLQFHKQLMKKCERAQVLNHLEIISIRKELSITQMTKNIRNKIVSPSPSCLHCQSNSKLDNGMQLVLQQLMELDLPLYNKYKNISHNL